jgi:16S rRNA C967 or C1407 C5-methylase (RsmB/RsmF family)
MVYSTCSLTIQQNEENVAWFLNENNDSQLVKIPENNIKPAEIKQQTLVTELQKDIEEHCVRFDPIESSTSGFFLARFIKK